MKLILAIGCFFWVIGNTSAQSFVKFSIGGSVHGSYCNAINPTSSADVISRNSAQSGRFSGGFAVWSHLFINKRWSFQGGVGYVDMGFRRTQSNIQFGDSLFLGIGQGKLMEKSSGSGEKSVDYNYRYQYLQVPFLFHYEVYNSKDFYYKISMTAGVGVNFLLNHEIKANLNQFVVEGQNVYHLDSTGYEGKKVTFTLMFGAKGEYRVDKKTIVYVMPVIGITPMSVTTTPINSYPYYIQLNLGVQYAFNMKDEKRR